MKATVHTDAMVFAKLARPFYATDPVRHTAALTGLGNIERTGTAGLAVTVANTDELHGVLLGDRSFPATASGLPVDAAPIAAEAAAQAGATLTGVRGPSERAQAFADAWSAATGATVENGARQWLYELGRLVEPRGVRGEARLATPADMDLLVSWRRSFMNDVLVTYREPAGGEEAEVRRLLADGSWYGLWWVGDEPVAMAVARDPECGASRVSYVYTPPDHRGHGYASALTATVSRWAREAGTRHVVLFAEVDNPISNRIYQRMGYRRLFENVELSFSATPARTLGM